MIYSTIGIPSRFSEWSEKVLTILVTAAAEEPAQFGAESLEKVGQELLTRDSTHAVIVSRQPHSSLSQAISARPFLVTLDSPEHAVASLMVDHDVPFTEAVRATANAMIALLPVYRHENALVLRADETVSAKIIAEHFGLSADHSTIATLPDCEPPPALPDLPHDDAALSSPTARALHQAIGTTAAMSVLNPLWKALAGELLTEIFWSPALFFLEQAPKTAPTGPIDVTGSARCLIYGPYLRLPEGPWSCSIVFACTKGGAKMVAEVFAEVPLNRVNFELNEAGVFEIELSFENSYPDRPIEVRLFTAEAAFEGEFMLGQVRMKPLKARRLSAG